MLKISTDMARFALNGPVMGTRWSAVFHADKGTDTGSIRAALATRIEEVDRQMSTWNPSSDLMRLNAAPVGVWTPVPPALMEVLSMGLAVGRASDGAFDIGLGDLVTAWGFGPQATDPGAVRAALGKARLPAHEVLDLDPDGLVVRKRAPLMIDLSGIAKGYGVDCMVGVLDGFGITSALVGLDGELRAKGALLDGMPWTIAVERPDFAARAPLSILALEDAAVATSGDYRHWVDLGAQRLSHTMDGKRGGPVAAGPASVTVIAARCMEADAWATAFMVLGVKAGAALAARLQLSALFIGRDGENLVQTPVGPVFCAAPVDAEY